MLPSVSYLKTISTVWLLINAHIKVQIVFFTSVCDRGVIIHGTVAVYNQDEDGCVFLW